MKKQVLAISLGLFSLGLFAQKDQIKTIEKALKKEDVTTARQVISELETNEDAIEEKYRAKYYFLKGQAYGKSNIEKAANAYQQLFAYEKEIGKEKYTKDAEPMLNELIQFVSEQAINLYNNDKDYKNAAKKFYMTFALSPKDTIYLYNAAVSASLAQDYDTSLDYYKKLQDIGYTGITMQYFAVNKETGAKENLGSKQNRDLLVKAGGYSNPTDEPTESKQGDIVKNISYIYINQGKTDEAIVAITEARKSNPKDLNLILNEAQLYAKLEQMDKFASLMEEAIELDPKNPILFFNIGVVNQNENKVDKAIEYYKKAIELDPNYGDAYMNIAVAMLFKEQAIVEEMNKNLSNFKKYDELQLQQKELYKKALPYLEKADEISRSMDTVRSLLNIYDVLEMTDKAKAMREIYNKMRG